VLLETHAAQAHSQTLEEMRLAEATEAAAAQVCAGFPNPRGCVQ
jgi:hypothetical protein